MTQIATRPTKLGNLLKGEFWAQHGYERESLTVNVTSGMEIGAVVKNDGDDTYSAVVAADVTPGPLGEDIGIVIDNTIYELTTTGDTSVACLRGGPGASGGAIVVREQLKFGDSLTEGEVDTVVASLEARGIKVVSQV